MSIRKYGSKTKIFTLFTTNFCPKYLWESERRMKELCRIYSNKVDSIQLHRYWWRIWFKLRLHLSLQTTKIYLGKLLNSNASNNLSSSLGCKILSKKMIQMYSWHPVWPFIPFLKKNVRQKVSQSIGCFNIWPSSLGSSTFFWRQ